jgi:hypothetical protein
VDEHGEALGRDLGRDELGGNKRCGGGPLPAVEERWMSSSAFLVALATTSALAAGECLGSLYPPWARRPEKILGCDGAASAMCWGCRARGGAALEWATAAGDACGGGFGRGGDGGRRCVRRRWRGIWRIDDGGRRAGWDLGTTRRGDFLAKS